MGDDARHTTAEISYCSCPYCSCAYCCWVYMEPCMAVDLAGNFSGLYKLGTYIFISIVFCLANSKKNKKAYSIHYHAMV